MHERRNSIVDKVMRERMVKVTDLVQEFEVSIETIRRDLEYLERIGTLTRVYGGAVCNKMYGHEPSFEYREITNYEYKKAIAATAADLIEDGDTLFLDVGTTPLEVARRLYDKKNLTVITNATKAAHIIVAGENNQVILLGGVLRSGELSVSGFLTDHNMAYFHASTAILGVGGITLNNGITDYHIEEANTRRTFIAQADKIIAVADYSKFGVTAMNSVCPVSKITTLVTDWTTPTKVLAEYRAAGVHVIIAPNQDA